MKSHATRVHYFHTEISRMRSYETTIPHESALNLQQYFRVKKLNKKTGSTAALQDITCMSESK